jgi:hypothetical protein
MATETQEAAKLDQLAHINQDEIEIAAGREREQLEGWTPELASEAEIREALEKAFDYRGDVTITRKGRLAGRRLPLRSPHWHNARRLLHSHHPVKETTKVNIAYCDVAALVFTGGIRRQARASRPG